MNEEELKNLWQTDRQTPTIDFARMKNLSNDWQVRLRRKARVDAWMQSAAAIIFLLPVFYNPKMIFASVPVLLLGVWYVRELRRLYRMEIGETDEFAVKQFLEAKIETLKNYFRRTRIVIYTLTPLILISAYYAYGRLDQSSATFPGWISLVKTLITSETAVVVCLEIYFRILYAPALNELKNLLRQLDFKE